MTTAAGMVSTGIIGNLNDIFDAPQNPALYGIILGAVVLLG